MGTPTIDSARAAGAAARPVPMKHVLSIKRDPLGNYHTKSIAVPLLSLLVEHTVLNPRSDSELAWRR